MKPYDSILRCPPADLVKFHTRCTIKWSRSSKTQCFLIPSHQTKLKPIRVIPAGTQIYVPPYTLHRDPRYFPLSPDKFIPERWLDDKELDTTAFIPFSYGPANCVGRRLAKQELLMVTSTLLQRFTLSLADGYNSDDWPKQAKDYLTVTRAPLFVRAAKRD